MFLTSLRWLFFGFPYLRGTRILRSILVLLSGFAAKSTGKLDSSGSTGEDALRAVFPSIVLMPMTGKYFINYFQLQEVVGCVCMLNGLFSSKDVFAQTTTTTMGCVADEGKIHLPFLPVRRGRWVCLLAQ